MLPAPTDRDAAERELNQLVRQINNLGPVNQVAMEEYEQLKRRADYIEEQLADLESARKALTKITVAIDRKMRKAFLVTFEKVDANFREIFAMLFPGGQAHLEMTDPEHPAETGIEVVAQPRGKRITKMMLMSGGEKSLTALALLFAVYRTRTVPFYVLDEVEAALDDANLSKLISALMCCVPIRSSWLSRISAVLWRTLTFSMASRCKPTASVASSRKNSIAKPERS